MNENLLSMLLGVARFNLEARFGPEPHSPPLTSQQIDEVVMALPPSLMLSVGDAHRAAHLKEVSRRLEVGQRVKIADPTILRGDIIDWYFGEKKVGRRQWERYKRFLKNEQQFDDKTVAAIDLASDAVMAGLGDPQSKAGFDQRGLVVGQVQSGKTTSYSAVVNKAIDAGYRIIIILTGVHEGLRMQTQARIEDGVRGLATESDRPDGPHKDSPLPLLRHGDVPVVPVPMTTRAKSGDFSQDAHHYASLASTAPVIFVIKKNAGILRNVQNFFSASHIGRIHDPATGRDEIGNLPLLLIDDEADAASIDTKRKKKGKTDHEHDPATINREIRRLLLQFHQRSYVAYTATPYANILIHKENVNKNEGRDLFPKDFVVMLAAPSNYVGPGVFFGSGCTEGDTPTPPDLLRVIKDCGVLKDADKDWMPLLHKKTHRPAVDKKSVIPKSLEDAILSFLLTVAIRRLRGYSTAHNSMLVHVSRYTDVQAIVRKQVEEFLYELKAVFAGIGTDALMVDRLNALLGEVVETSLTLAEHERGSIPEWKEVRAALPDILELVVARQVNSIGGGLDYDSFPKGLNVIAIGGDKLSRGLTLEGLSVSYFLRATKMYDTLLQMGRWFGYRPGYKDLCRLFLTQDLKAAYGHVTKADEELRAEFKLMQAQNLKPKDYGLRVRSHPTLMVTAPGKMTSATKMTLDFGGRVTQTIHFFRQPEKLVKNQNSTKEFLQDIAICRDGFPVKRDTKDGRLIASKMDDNGALYRRVPPAAIAAYLTKYNFHDGSRRVAAGKLLEYLQSAWKAGVATDWSVVVVSGPGTATDFGEGVNVGAVRRGITEQATSGATADSQEDAIAIGVLSSPQDLIADLSDQAAAKLASFAAPSASGVPGDEAIDEQVLRTRACLVRDEKSALLVIYVVEPTSGKGKAKTPLPLEPGAVLPIGLAFVLPGSNRFKLPNYLLNSVYDDIDSAIGEEEEEE